MMCMGDERLMVVVVVVVVVMHGKVGPMVTVDGVDVECDRL